MSVQVVRHARCVLANGCKALRQLQQGQIARIFHPTKAASEQTKRPANAVYLVPLGRVASALLKTRNACRSTTFGTRTP